MMSTRHTAPVTVNPLASVRLQPELLLLVLGAIGFLLGFQAMRAFFSSAVWIIGEDHSTNFMGAVAFGIYFIGLIAYLPTRLFGGAQPALRFGTLFVLLHVANQATAHPIADATLAGAAAVAWYWWFPAYVELLVRRGGAVLLLAALLVGLSLDTLTRTLLGGLDLLWLHGALPFVAALVLAGLFFAALRGSKQADATTVIRPGWGLMVLGPFLFLQFTLLTNLGQVQMLSGLNLGAAAAIILLGLVLAGALLSVNLPPYAPIVGGLIAVAILFQPELMRGAGISLLIVVQAGLSLAVSGALTARKPGTERSLYIWIPVGSLLMFVLLFLYYAEYEWLTFWVVGALLVTVGAAGAREAARLPLRRKMIMMLPLLVVGPLVAHYLYRGMPPSPAPAPAQLKVMTYNIHMGMNDNSVANPEAIAREIEAANADIVGIQEVGRGWTVNGGVDLVPWLRWRLPQYQVIYHPMNGDLWGNLILSRYAVQESGYVLYPIRSDTFQRGLQWATIETVAGDLLVINTHLTAYESAERDQDRDAEAGDLLAFWAGRPHTIALGDFNAHPGDPALVTLLGGGLVDLPAAQGLKDTYTFNFGNPHQRIDYVLGSADVTVTTAKVRQTGASDHMPVEAEIELRR